ncbi:MAG: MBL fold metallo-hydrolase [Anaerolineae bacterium]|nr:MBL fold metallo-hydrolase [Anaerolineae bacterium]
MIDRIHWLGHSSFLIQGPPLIYIDPWRIARSAFLADVILISQVGYDHCSPADVEKLLGPETVLLADEMAAGLLDGLAVEVLRPWQSRNVNRARITAIPAYTRLDARDPLTSQGVGYLISLDTYDIYYAGDTMLLPDMTRIHPDIAILPVGSSAGLMNVDAAVEAVRLLKPRWVVPSHWGAAEGGSYLDLRTFQAAVGKLAEVVIPDRLH